jgi:hypothetical protein
MSRKPSLRQLETEKALEPPQPAPKSLEVPSARPEPRNRLQLDLSPSVAALLERAATTTGVPKAQLVVQALLVALPGLVDLAESIQQRADMASRGDLS